MSNTERTYIMIKPDGVQRGLIGTIIQRFEQRGFILRGLKMMSVEKAHAEAHYADLSSKPFFAGLVEYICSAPVWRHVLGGQGRREDRKEDHRCHQPPRLRARKPSVETSASTLAATSSTEVTPSRAPRRSSPCGSQTESASTSTPCRPGSTSKAEAAPSSLARPKRWLGTKLLPVLKTLIFLTK
ncbi:nucleoside diphosphate kinase [Chloropicon roscoffensis]|uniref:nucleoside-diphosphate kinase n=1 Tax=Chloropicon roscoffensis TaxID=1461544 RepID=A0AAX4PGE2_9CHLO